MLSLPSSPSSSISRHKYDVFLSFRGEDTRRNFSDHLYAALVRSGIVTFRDDPRLEAGDEIAPELFKAIQESWCSLIVFSKTYTFSSWCLDELAEIVQQKKERRHKVFPIFYDVDPSDLRKQTGKVEEAFAKHEKTYKAYKDKIQRWRKALTEVTNLTGWDLKNRHESEFIEDIVKKISAKLSLTYADVTDGLIGINSRLEELHSKLNIGGDDVRIIGICGMGGIGKTTLARVVYDRISPYFMGKSFLANVREVSEKRGLVSLQKQLLSQILSEKDFNLFNEDDGKAIIRCRLSHKKVFIVIDDVDNLQHLKWLVGRRDWFGSGSRIIVITRNEQLLLSLGVDDVYKPTTLDYNEALQLFNLKAFNSDTVPEDFFELSKQVVEYTGGLPLALEVLGSSLCDGEAYQWRSEIERLKRDFKKDIHDILQISFDGLEETEKKIFLDIACFFNGEEKDFVTKVLDGCGLFPDTGLRVLVKKSLIKVVGNKYLRMHNLLQEMGRKIVRQKCVDEPGKRCRLWEENDVYHVLTKNTIFASAKRDFKILVPGREIPEWFSHQTDEASIKISLPPNIGNDSRWLGVAHCCVFVSAFNGDDAWEHDYGEEVFSISYYMHGRRSRHRGGQNTWFGEKSRRQRDRKGHICQHYFSRGSLYPYMDSCGGTGIFECIMSIRRYFKLKKCGLRIVYKEDMEEMEEIKEQCSSPASENFDDWEWWCPCKAMEKILNFIC